MSHVNRRGLTDLGEVGILALLEGRVGRATTQFHVAKYDGEGRVVNGAGKVHM